MMKQMSISKRTSIKQRMIIDAMSTNNCLKLHQLEQMNYFELLCNIHPYDRSVYIRKLHLEYSLDFSILEGDGYKRY